jgi:hypothetical protein
MTGLLRFGSLQLAATTLAVVLASSAWAAERRYDDVPDGGNFYFYPGPGVDYSGPAARAPVASRPGARVYGYGPVYRYNAPRYAAPPPVARDQAPLGTYAPAEPENLSPSRGFFLGIERQAGD